MPLAETPSGSAQAQQLEGGSSLAFLRFLFYNIHLYYQQRLSWIPPPGSDSAAAQQPAQQASNLPLFFLNNIWLSVQIGQIDATGEDGLAAQIAAHSVSCARMIYLPSAEHPIRRSRRDRLPRS